MKTSKILFAMATALLAASAAQASGLVTSCDARVFGAAGQAECLKMVRDMTFIGRTVNDATVAAELDKLAPRGRVYDSACLAKLMFVNGELVSRTRDETAVCVTEYLGADPAPAGRVGGY